MPEVVCRVPGCMLPDQHVPGCELRGCAGCRGRPVELGLLCSRHLGWLRRDLAAVPSLVWHVRLSRMPGSPRDDVPVSGGAVAPPAPLDVSAVDAVDEVAALLVVAAQSMAEQLGRRQPRGVGLLWRSGVVTQGLPAWMTAREAARVMAELIEFWRVSLQEFVQREDIVDVAVELHAMVGRIRARWPEEERPRLLPGTPCRECGLADLWWVPPQDERWPVTVECRSCGYVAPEEDLVRLTKLVEFHHQERKASQRVLSHGWITVEQACAEFGISRATLWRWRGKYDIREAKLSPHMPLMLSRDDLLIVERVKRQPKCEAPWAQDMW